MPANERQSNGINDLGPLNGPVLVFGGPYGNLQALQAIRAVAEAAGIPPERCICTGDVTAYCADPAATVAAIRGWGAAVVMGNCEEQLGEHAETCGCGFEEGMACDALSAAWWAHVDREIGPDDRRWMAALPRRLNFSVGGVRFAAIHGGAGQIARFLFASAADADLAGEIAATGADAVVAGHCGIPFTRIVGGRLWHNAGVIGMPANDGTPDVWYSLLQPGATAGAVTVSHHRLAYDHAAAARAMRTARLPEGYAAALKTGLWPSLDVLPSLERRNAGVPLALDRPVTFRRTDAAANV